MSVFEFEVVSADFGHERVYAFGQTSDEATKVLVSKGLREILFVRELSVEEMRRLRYLPSAAF